MSRTALIREYYRRIDQGDVDWVVGLFASDAVYERADALYDGIAAITHFFAQDRRIRGVHEIESIVAAPDAGVVTANGRFVGVGEAGDPRSVGFADLWRFAPSGLIMRRQTYLALGNDYVRA